MKELCKKILKKWNYKKIWFILNVTHTLNKIMASIDYKLYFNQKLNWSAHLKRWHKIFVLNNDLLYTRWIIQKPCNIPDNVIRACTNAFSYKFPDNEKSCWYARRKDAKSMLVLSEHDSTSPLSSAMLSWSFSSPSSSLT